MINFARANRLELSMATFRMLDDLLLKIVGKTGKAGDLIESVGSLHFLSRLQPSLEIDAPRFFYSLPFSTESLTNSPLTELPNQRLRSSSPLDEF